MTPLATLLLTFVLAAAPQATGRQTSTHRIIGLVEVPGLFGVLEPGAPAPVPPSEVVPIALRARPTSESPLAFRLEGADQLASREHGYEHRSAVVYDMENGWYLVSYSDAGRTGMAWLSPDDAGTFRSVVTLLEDGLSYMTAVWDRRLYQTPDRMGPSTTLTAHQGVWSITVAHSRVEGAEPWLRVVVQEGSPCEGESHPRVHAAGWVPLYAEDGQLNAWFYARGC